MEPLKVTGIEYSNTRRGIAYTCTTNINGLTIENEGNGSGTFLFNYGKVENSDYVRMYKEHELEELINEYEESLLDKNQQTINEEPIMKNQELFSILSKMDITDLIEVNKQVIDVIKSKKQVRDNLLRTTISEGDTVAINKDRFSGSRFVVEKVNRTKAILRKEGSFQQYNVPFSLIQHLW